MNNEKNSVDYCIELTENKVKRRNCSTLSNEQSALYCLVYCFDGEVTTEINKKHFYLKQKEVLLIPTNINFAIKQSPDSDKVVIFFPKSVIHEIIEATGDFSLFTVFFPNAYHLELPEKKSFRVESAFRTIFDEISEHEIGAHIIIQKTLYTVITNILRSKHFGTKLEIEKIREKPDDCVFQIIDFINKNYYESISLDLLSKMVYVNPSMISRDFKARTGMNLVDFINNKRLEAAAELLTQNKNSLIIDIAIKVGFNSSTYFARLFRKKYNYTPHEYRNLHMKSQEE